MSIYRSIPNTHPTTEQILRLFSFAARNKLVENDKAVQTFDIEFTHLQRQVLRLLAVPEQAVML